jgi:hypothetical protein
MFTLHRQLGDAQYVGRAGTPQCHPIDDTPVVMRQWSSRPRVGIRTSRRVRKETHLFATNAPCARFVLGRRLIDRDGFAFLRQNHIDLRVRQAVDRLWESALEMMTLAD